MRLIDADNLISLVMDSTILGSGFKQAFVALVNGEPTVEPTQKMGKWMQTETMNIYECSCCHSRWNVYYVCDFDYCPHCGAKMEVERDE